MSKAEKSKPKRSSQGGLVIWHGMTISGLAGLLAHHPTMHWTRSFRILSLFPAALYNSVMAAIEHIFYGRKIAAAELVGSPIFILGHWRSGTTLIHNLITSDPQFTSPTMYQTLFPNHFLLTETVAKKLTAVFVPKTRPMDNMPVHWDIPQEDELALCILSQVSPYTGLALPDDLDVFREYLDIEKLQEIKQKRWKEALIFFLKKITVRIPKQIVLKSPSHTYRVKTLLKVFPDARFIYIYRNPFDVFNSTCHLRRTMIDGNTLGRNIYKDLENDVLYNYELAIESYETDKQLIPAGHLHELKYEDLAADPLAEMEKIYESLQIEHVDEMRRAVAPQVEKLKNYKKNSFVPDPKWAREVYHRCRAIYERYGYPPPLEELIDNDHKLEEEATSEA